MNQQNDPSQSDAILENLLDAVLVVDMNGTIIYGNKSAEKLFGRRTTKLIGQPFGFSVTPSEVQEIQVIQEKDILTVEMLATTIVWNGMDAFLMALRDITEKKKLENRLHDAYNELMIAQRQLKILNGQLEEKVRERTLELEKKNIDLNAYAEHLKKAYDETEVKVKFRNLEMEKIITELKQENEELKGKFNL